MSKDSGRRRLTSALSELEFEAAPDTSKDEVRRCRYCDLELPHRYDVGYAGRWVAIKHDAPCGLPCLGGGVNATVREFHSDRCPRCSNGV